MKKTIRMALVASLTILSLSACQPTAKDCIEDLQDLVEEVKENGKDYTEEQWADVQERYDKLVEKAEQIKEMTPEETRELAKVQGAYAAEIVKDGADNLRKGMEKAGKALEGFMEGLTEGSEED